MKVEPRMTERTTRGRSVGLVLALSLVLACAPARAQHDHEDPPLPVAGDVIAAFDAESVDGAVKKVAFEGKGSTVLLFFLSSCPTCHRMIPEWNRAFQRRPQGLQVIGVLMDHETPGFFQSMPVAFPVVRSPGRPFLQKLKISRAPIMLRVGRGGKVEDVAVGLNDPIRVGEIFRP
jgi:redoxin